MTLGATERLFCCSRLLLRLWIVAALGLSGCKDVSNCPDTGSGDGGGDTVNDDIAADDPIIDEDAEDVGAEDGDVIAGTCSGFDPLRQPFFGDLHVHSSFSIDAWIFGTRTSPLQAHQFARGASVGLAPFDEEGHPARIVQIRRPLDFMALTDHSEFLGEWLNCVFVDEETGYTYPGYDSSFCELYREAVDNEASFSRVVEILRAIMDNPDAGRPELNGHDVSAEDVWTKLQEIANGENDPCEFTSFIGYEWTGKTNNSTVHRNVIFRNDKIPPTPTSYLDQSTAQGLWEELDTTCREMIPECDVITIPHNSNLSEGNTFNVEYDSPENAALRADFEPVVEIMQHKGSSECALGVNTADELCDFELIPRFPMFGEGPSDIPLSYVREGLKEGMKYAELPDSEGINPIKMGIIASTDTHNGTPGFANEEDYIGVGHLGKRDDEPSEQLEGEVSKDIYGGPGGLAGVWAGENTRDSIFDAFKRREVFGTSGTFITVRFFGGWDFPADMCASTGFAGLGYELGEPMGSDLRPLPGDTARPMFAVSAWQDPARLPDIKLEKIQVIKVWIEDGEARERIIDVAGGDNDADVNLDTCATTGSGGWSMLCAVWTDEEFQPDQRAFYYARVIENPTCRWSKRLCNALALDCSEPGDLEPWERNCCEEVVSPGIQERAWSSPIWYTP